MWPFVLLTLFVLCVLLWTGTLVAVVVGLATLAFHTIRFLILAVGIVLGSILWVVLFLIRPKAMLQSYREASARLQSLKAQPEPAPPSYKLTGRRKR